MTGMWWGIAALNLAAAALNWYFAATGHTLNGIIAVANTLMAAYCVGRAVAAKSRAF